MLRSRVTGALVAAVFCGACGLVSSDVANFNLRFPSHNFQIDTADWKLTPGAQVPSVPCATGCANASAALCMGSCSVDCQDSANLCQAHITVSLRNDYDLAHEAPEYAKIADQPLISVTVDDIYFSITENTLSVPTPTLQVVLGPVSVAGPNDPGAEIVGTIDPIAPAQTGRVNVQFVTGGQAILKKYMDDFHTPFRVIVSGSATVHGGDPTPQGRLVGSVQADAHASLGS